MGILLTVKKVNNVSNRMWYTKLTNDRTDDKGTASMEDLERVFSQFRSIA
jgi:hypothetical protein